MTSTPILAYYNATKSTCVRAEANSYGVGGVIMRDHGVGKSETCYVLLENLDPCRATVRTNRKGMLSECVGMR